MTTKTTDYSRRYATLALALASLTLILTAAAWSKPHPSAVKFEISFPTSVHAEPITGRVFVVLTKAKGREPRLQVGSWGDAPPLFGADVERLRPGKAAVIDAGTLGYPVQSLRGIVAGDYDVQALLNVYTEFHRPDGHTIWAHMDRWEGQQFNRSPGNLYSEVRTIHLDPEVGYDVKLSLTKVIPAIQVPPDTEWVKRVKIQSKLLTEFWGHPIDLGATVLLPRGYSAHPNVNYPVLYEQGHFSLSAPLGFRTENPPANSRPPSLRSLGLESGYEFYKEWNSDNFPRMIGVTFQHPTPYFDDSYAVNSVNNGPYGDAILTELIPYIEERFRIIRQPYARVLSGGSTGGWESLALQLYHSDFFGGTWTFYPDPIDFRRYGMVNIYDDDNAFLAPRREWLPAERPLRRSAEGQVECTMRELSQLEAVLGSRGRSGQQLEIWEAVYGPAGNDGYPKPLWDKLTGKIDHEVAKDMREHGYDLRFYAETNWSKIGPQLIGKVHLYCGDMDNYYLNLAVYLFEDFLKATKDPYFAGSFEYGRPMKGHGWHPMTQSQLIRMMAAHIAKNAPEGGNTATWNYN